MVQATCRDHRDSVIVMLHCQQCAMVYTMSHNSIMTGCSVDLLTLRMAEVCHALLLAAVRHEYTAPPAAYTAEAPWQAAAPRCSRRCCLAASYLRRCAGSDSTVWAALMRRKRASEAALCAALGALSAHENRERQRVGYVRQGDAVVSKIVCAS